MAGNPLRVARVAPSLWTAAQRRAQLEGVAPTSSAVLRAALEAYASGTPTPSTPDRRPRKGPRS